MSVMLDGKVAFVLNLIGFNWPAADEDKLRQSAHHWREYATELEHAIADTNRILLQVRAENSAESIDALEQHWQEFGQHLHRAHDAAGTVAEVLDEFALVVEGLKLKVAVQLLLLAGELTATTGAAFLTFGLAEAAAPEEIIATQGFMRLVTNVAIQKVERLVADKVAKKVVEHFLSIKNGLKALKAAPRVLKDFGKGLGKGGVKELEHGRGLATRRLESTGRVGYGTTDLGKATIEYRRLHDIKSARNVAVFEYVQGGAKETIAMASQRGVGHSERLVAKELERLGIDPQNVTRVYSELEPCVLPGAYCKKLLTGYSNASVTFSFEYGATEASRKAGVEALQGAVGAVFK
jgi:hypothetical protein